MVGPLALNNEPLASIYTGAPEPASGTIQTPFLGGNLVKNQNSDVRTDGKDDNDKDQSGGVNAF